MPLFQKRLIISRGLLIAGLLVVISAHFFPLEQTWAHPSLAIPYVENNFISAIWKDVWEIVKHPLSYTLAGWQSALIFLGTALLLLALPFLPGILSRARTLRWLAIFMLAASTGCVLYYITLWCGNLAASGCHLILTGLWLVLIGLLLIPDARAGECAATRWKLPLTLAILFTALIASPRIFRSQIDRRLHKERWLQNDQCFFLLGSALLSFKKEAGRFPTNHEGWKPLLSQPAAWPLVPRAHDDPAPPAEPWHPFLTGIPRDPWGGEYLYDLKIPNSPFIISKGPDGIAGTRDDIRGP